MNEYEKGILNKVNIFSLFIQEIQEYPAEQHKMKRVKSKDSLLLFISSADHSKW